MAKSLKHCPGGLNPEAWVLDPSAWGFVGDVWGSDFDVEDFAASAQSFPISARALPVDEFGFAVDHDVSMAQPPKEPAAVWDFDPEWWGFATGWTDRTIGDS